MVPMIENEADDYDVFSNYYLLSFVYFVQKIRPAPKHAKPPNANIVKVPK